MGYMRVSSSKMLLDYVPGFAIPLGLTQLAD
jgi:hypothetical protein